MLEAAAEFRDQAAVPESAGMTGAELNFHRIRAASQRATLELADEILRRHQDGQDPLRIQPRAGFWQEPTVERWRKNLIQEFEHFNEREMRDEHIEAYGFAVMTQDAMEWLRKTIGDDPIVEIGAGNGWLAREMNHHGFTVHPTDPLAPHESHYGLGPRMLTPVERLDGLQAIKKYPDCNMLWSWPEMRDYVESVMRAFTGKYLVYIGEDGNGCTGPHRDMVVTMGGHYRETGQYDLPNFPGIHDRMHVLERIDYHLEPRQPEPAGSRPAPAPEGGIIRPDDLNDILMGRMAPDLAERLAQAGHRWQVTEEDEDQEGGNLRRNVEFSIMQTVRCAVSDAMRYGDPGLRTDLTERLLLRQQDEREWAEQTIQAITGFTRDAVERYVAQENADAEGDRTMIQETSPTETPTGRGNDWPHRIRKALKARDAGREAREKNPPTLSMKQPGTQPGTGGINPR